MDILTRAIKKITQRRIYKCTKCSFIWYRHELISGKCANCGNNVVKK